MKKIIRLTESDLARIVKRVLDEQFDGDIQTSEPEPKSTEQNLTISQTKLNQLKQIFQNFSEINCDNVGGYGDDYFDVPEYTAIYCRHYKGKPRSYIYNLIKKYQQEQ